MNWSGMMVFLCSSAVHLRFHPTTAVYRCGIISAIWICCGCSGTHRRLTTIQPTTGTTLWKFFPQQKWLVSFHFFIGFITLHSKMARHLGLKGRTEVLLRATWLLYVVWHISYIYTHQWRWENSIWIYLGIKIERRNKYLAVRHCCYWRKVGEEHAQWWDGKRTKEKSSSSSTTGTKRRNSGGGESGGSTNGRHRRITVATSNIISTPLLIVAATALRCDGTSAFLQWLPGSSLFSRLSCLLWGICCTVCEKMLYPMEELGS